MHALIARGSEVKPERDNHCLQMGGYETARACVHENARERGALIGRGWEGGGGWVEWDVLI